MERGSNITCSEFITACRKFIIACRDGDIEEAKRLYSFKYLDGRRRRYINIRMEDDCAFRMSCENGHKEIAEWLYNLGANIHAEDDYTFRASCSNGHKEIAEWHVAYTFFIFSKK